VGDDHDREFIKTALISTLSPANSSYVKLVPEIEVAEKKAISTTVHVTTAKMVWQCGHGSVKSAAVVNLQALW
jgi:hypothetical protein